MLIDKRIAFDDTKLFQLFIKVSESGEPISFDGLDEYELEFVQNSIAKFKLKCDAGYMPFNVQIQAPVVAEPVVEVVEIQTPEKTDVLEEIADVLHTVKNKRKK